MQSFDTLQGSVMQSGSVTRFLNSIESDESYSADDLVPVLYEELRRLASSRLAKESSGQTLQATALVHEAYLRLVQAAGSEQWKSRGHFFGAAAEAMRRIMIESARRKRSLKRGAGAEKIDLSNIELAIETDDERLLLVNDALEKLSAHDPKAAQLVKLRFFAGLSGEEAADALELPQRTATRLWSYARAWLYRELSTT